MIKEINKMETIASTAGILGKIQEGEKLKKDITEAKASIISNEEVVNAIDEAVAKMTEQEILSLSLEECNNILQVNNEDSDLGMKFDSEERELDFKRNYLEYCRKSVKTFEEIDTLNDTLAKELKENEDEINDVLTNIGDTQIFFREQLIEKLSNENTTEAQKLHIESSIKNLDDTIEFKSLFNLYSSINKQNVMRDYFHNSEYVFNKYKKKIEPLNIKTDITKFAGLEKEFLPEKYHTYQNLFLFLVIRYYSSKTSMKKSEDGLFLSQLMINVRGLFDGKMSIEKKEFMLKNIQKVLDLFI